MRTLSIFAFASICITASPALALSPETDAFIANVRVNSSFLAASSTLAGDHSASADLRTYAGKEASGQQAVLDTLDRRAVPQVETSPMAMASGDAVGDVVTGRSAAVDGDAAIRFVPPEGTGALMPAAAVALDHLAQTRGEAFDGLFKATQVNALRQLSGLYNAYAMTGDDDALRQLAKSELAATDARIADLGRL